MSVLQTQAMRECLLQCVLQMNNFISVMLCVCVCVWVSVCVSQWASDSVLLRISRCQCTFLLSVRVMDSRDSKQRSSLLPLCSLNSQVHCSSNLHIIYSMPSSQQGIFEDRDPLWIHLWTMKISVCKWWLRTPLFHVQLLGRRFKCMTSKSTDFI